MGIPPSEKAGANGGADPGHQLLAHGIELAARGDLQTALASFEQAMEVARRSGDSELLDRAFCNRCAILVEDSLDAVDLAELRRIVLRSSNSENSFLAAYHVARAYECDRDFHKALFYARIAQDRCQHTQRTDWVASSCNQLGNLLLADSHFAEACAEYEQALDLVPATPSLPRAQLLDNLGYCRIVQGRMQDGFRMLLESVRTLVRFGFEREQAPPRISLCFAYLEAGRYRSALRQGLRALELGTRHDDTDVVRNAHFLLGETYNQLGHSELARFHFKHLQQRFYPDAPNITDLLLAIDVRGMINLKA